MKVLAITNQKGGVGKTTTSINLTTGFAACGNNVLILDIDPQANATTGLGFSSYNGYSTYEFLLGNCRAEDVIKQTSIPGLDIIPSSMDLAAIEIEIASEKNREYLLKERISSIASYNRDYDYVVVDCPPSLGLLTINALSCADAVIVPLQCEYYALEGLTHLIRTVDSVKKVFHPSLEIEGVVLTMYDKRNKLTDLVEEDVRQCLGDKVFNTVIPRNVRLSEAPSFGKPALIYDTNCSGSKAYMMLAKEIMQREKREVVKNGV